YVNTNVAAPNKNGTLVLTYFSWGTVVPTLIVSIPCLLFPFAMTFSNISMTKRVANKSKRQI
ncbi:hypothetical protein, partial [Mycoplasmopsis bovis]|uniref:hypothetical protein n=1 Tax=Mycoplasmopsis bovis TaxID=28903 RepID=UPI003D2D7E1F